MQPFDVSDVEVHPRGLIYLPHERLRDRLNAAFGAGFYKFLPVGDPMMGASEVIWRFRLSFRDGTEAEAVGHAKYIKNNPSYSYGDALETCNSDALARCCKSCGIGLQVWNRDYQINFMQKYSVRVAMLDGGKDQYRRKDRPPLNNERQSERQQGPDYVPRETLDQANRAHFDSLKPDPEMPSSRARPEQDTYPYKPLVARPAATPQVLQRTIRREEATWDPEDDEQLRRLHEIEEEVFYSDAREGN